MQVQQPFDNFRRLLLAYILIILNFHDLPLEGRQSLEPGIYK